MPRRVSMPAADDLFRKTGDTSRVRAVPDAPPDPDPADDTTGPKRPSGRVRHDEKMTVYVTSEELLDLEQARLTLRRDLGMAIDRGRLVREAVALALVDLDENGQDSALARRLSEG